jgi:hypothetical protein
MGKRDLRRALLPIVWIFLISLLPAAACSPAHTTVSKSADFDTATATLRQEAVSVKIIWAKTGSKMTIKNNDPKFTQLLVYLSDSAVQQTTAKHGPVVINGKSTTTYATIGYAHGYEMTFKLKDDSTLWFNCMVDTTWYENADYIYQASFSKEFDDFLAGLNTW